MKFWVGVTDKNWFDYLRSKSPDEVNFWQPSGLPVANFLAPGDLFLFKLHSPNNFIAGGGFFVRFAKLPARMAWDAFEQKNGVASYSSLRDRVTQYRGPFRGDPDIGCNVLNAPFFWDREDWIPVPPSWSNNIVRGKTFDSHEGDGAAVWKAVMARLESRAASLQPAVSEPRYGPAYLAHARLGQGAFRVLVTDAYQRRCAVTGEKTLPVLEAAHIKPYSEEGPHHVSNGLLLRSDLHTLFDDGYLTVDGDLRLVVSSKIREEFQNGKEYYRYDGAPLMNLPGNADERPSRTYLEWHQNNRYLG